ncbi:MAG: SsrA-binding protein SmpB [Microbacteriaceae bacterium]|nr:SsrA-binding protein SmpB [Microbacteriaceae bacterium]
MPKEKGKTVVATNRKARHDYLIEDTYEAGIALTGTEVKVLRQGKASLIDGYAFVENGELWLDNVHIEEYGKGTWTNHSPRRRRKLLLKHLEIVKLSHRISQGGYTLIPLSLYFKDGWAKVELGVAKGKKDYDKRQTIRERDDKREAERAMRTRNRMGE